jgi:hypothetical protein
LCFRILQNYEKKQKYSQKLTNVEFSKLITKKEKLAINMRNKPTILV